MNYAIYIGDTETTHLDHDIGDVIELSLYRLTDDQQRTWCLKPTNPEGISDDALRINGHKKEDLLHQTKVGRETYLEPAQVLIEIENWMLEDGLPSSNRCLVAHNASFDYNYMKKLWEKNGFKDSYPFNRLMIDTLGLEFFFDYCNKTMSESYSLKALAKKYNVKNDKAHTAAADVKCLKEVFLQQVNSFTKP